MQGVDYAWGHPGGAALQAAGVHFACRYLSHDTSKAISRAEADDLAANGIWSAVVFEDAAQRPLSGYSAGVADAQLAQAQAAAAGMPGDRPIYFAVDFDVTPAQQAAVNAYLQGAGSVIGGPRVGVYGGYYTVQRALDAGVAAWAWQTVGWSGGQWEPRAQLRQPGGTVTIGGVDCDTNTATTADYGQWMPGITPNPVQEDIVTPDDVKAIATAAAQAVWDHQVPVPRVQPDGSVAYPMNQGAVWPLIWGNVWNAQLHTHIAAMQGALTSLIGQLGAAHPGVDTAAVVAAVQQAIADAVVKVDVTVAQKAP